MKSLYNILSIALYEAKTLFRSWFFRIFSLLALVILILLDVVFFALPITSQWMAYGIPASIPYMNLLLLNVAQAVIGVFMASDFLKYDRKLDTTDVVYMRSMTNADYVLGKTLGVLAVFGGLNLLVLIIALVFNVFFADVPVVASAYALYPLLISLPTLIFIFGLTFLLMVIIRSQAVTFIVLLGYIATTLFFLSRKFHYLFDYMAFNVPLMYSDFVGFGDISTILIHRGIYFLAGLGFVFTTILLLWRLPQSRIVNRVSMVLAIGCLAGAVMLGTAYLTRLSDSASLREKMLALSKDLTQTSTVSVHSCGLDLTHTGKEIAVRAGLAFTNKTPEDLERYIFSLNPGLEVTSVTRSGKDIPYTRNLHILSVEPEGALKPGAIDSLTISYRGSINEEACYLDIDDKTREENYRVLFYNLDKRYGFITPDYVLLTHENMWYPEAGIPEGAAYPELKRIDFITFNLSVKTAEGLRAVSQGKVTGIKAGEFVFSPEVPLPQLSLAIGQYETRSLTVSDSTAADTVEYTLYILKGHDYFSQYFNELQPVLAGDKGEKPPASVSDTLTPAAGDTLPSAKRDSLADYEKKTLADLIRDMRTDFENKLDLKYPYRRLSIIETPIQFFACPRLWTPGMETVQPEQVFLPEKGITLTTADFKRMNYFMSRRGQRGGRVMTTEEIQTNLFRQFVQTTFLGGSSVFRGLRSLRRTQSGVLSVGNFAMSLFLPNMGSSYNLFPQYYSYTHNFSSAKWPIFNVAMEFFLAGRIEDQPPPMARLFWGPSPEELANFALEKQTLVEILADPKDKEDVPDVMRLKSVYLFSLLQSELKKENFEKFLKDYLDSHMFTDSRVSEFQTGLKERFALDIETYLDSWLHEKKLAAFIVTDLDCYEVLDQERTRYQVVFKVYNPEPVGGLISVNFRRGGGGFRGFPGQGEQEEERLFRVNAGQNKEIAILLDDSPRAMTINTFVSQNLPSVIQRDFGELKPNKDAKPFEGERVLDQPATMAEPGTVIVDNEDPGFQIHSLASEGYLKKLMDRSNGNEDEYIGIQFWDLPRRWRATTHSDFYGAYKHSAYYIRAGEGGNKVSWKAELPRSGQYDVYYYVTDIRLPWMGRGRGGRGEDIAKDFHFSIYHDDGAAEVKLDTDGAQQGWNLLDTYYFSQGPARVELTDQSKGRMVYADAVKWVEHE
ncbi:MAG TPA: hypothetical protein VM123_04915 [archaeon]|nr:hypothetical protein [archaeon]